MATIQGYLDALDHEVHTLDGYENDVDVRCDPDANKRDCSTFVAFGFAEAGYGGIPLCANSYWLASWCYDQPRPDWFTARFGPGQGTFITYEQAQTVVCLGFRGNNWGRNEDDTGDGHVETILGQLPPSKRSVGAHSHATGIGYDPNGIDNHHLTHFAVPPCFLAEMAPPPWKVQPMYDPPLEIRADLKNPQGGRWEAFPDGRVRYVNRNGDVLVGGLDPSKPEWQAFHDNPTRQVAHLKLRWYRPKGSLLKKAGYTIVATDGAEYTPAAQH